MHIGRVGHRTEEAAGAFPGLVDVQADSLAVAVEVALELLLHVEGSVIVTDGSGHILDVVRQFDVLTGHSVAFVHIVGDGQKGGQVVDLPRVVLGSVTVQRLEFSADGAEVIVAVDLDLLVGNGGPALFGVLEVERHGRHRETCLVSARNDGGVERVTVASVNRDSHV